MNNMHVSTILIVLALISFGMLATGVTFYFSSLGLGLISFGALLLLLVLTVALLLMKETPKPKR